MNIIQLRYFMYVAKLGSFTTAGRKLSVTQSVLSRQIKALEHELGILLLARNTHFVRPTAAGMRLLEIVDPILSSFDQIPEKLRETEAEPAGSVTIGMLPSIAGSVTPSLLRRAGERLPNVRISVLEGLNSVLREGLALGNIDLAVLTAGTNVRGLAENTILEEEMVLTGHESLLANFSDPVNLAQLANVPLISTEGFRAVTYAAARASGVLLRFDMMQNSLMALTAMLEQKFGLSILPITVVYEEVRASRLAIRRIEGQGLSRALAIVQLGVRRPSRAHAAVEKLLAEELVDIIGQRRL
jgi:DNA-binding transcriptional LysR family regulator